MSHCHNSIVEEYKRLIHYESNQSFKNLSRRYQHIILREITSRPDQAVNEASELSSATNN